jgi:hypothetical protein
VSSNTALTDRDHDELALLYNVSVQDIAFFKKQQWVATKALKHETRFYLSKISK